MAATHDPDDPLNSSPGLGPQSAVLTTCNCPLKLPLSALLL